MEEFLEADVRIRSKAPVQPTITPRTFFQVIGSLIKRAAKIIVIIGVRDTIIDALTGVVLLSPTTKRNWFIITPKSEAKISSKTSFLLAFGALINRDAIQKTIAAPRKRK